MGESSGLINLVAHFAILLLSLILYFHTVPIRDRSLP